MAAPVVPRYPRRHFAITPSAVTKFHKPTTVYVGVAGDVQVKDWESGTTVVYKNAPAGSTIPVQVEMVLAASTTATDLVGII
jgi:hypothetical protein